MLNLKYWIVGLSLASGFVVSSEVANSVPRQADYFCYEQTAYGEVVNLTEICQKVQQKSASTNTGAKNSNSSTKESNAASTDRVRIEGQARKKKLEFSDYSYDGKMLVGTIKNRTGKSISDISVVYEIEVREGEGKWRSVDNGKVLANNESVAKGGKTNFSTSGMRSGDRVTITDVEFD
ncbi:MAG: hypothetical protein NW224_21985 [Leptolyngbyaceae cyanobacterium bins.302]|nr:hypothetical protein [Leptolyngbyaceae cyanobacterium bins.302]